MASMNVRELVEEGYPIEEAKRIMIRRTFGEDVKYDRHGNPIEQGIGSKSQPTPQSMAALLQHEGVDAHQRAIDEATRAGTWPPKPKQQEVF